MQIEIRPGRAKDLAATEALLRSAGLPTDGVVDLLESQPPAFYFAIRGEEVIAAGGLEPAGSDALLRSIVVRAEDRSTGVGKQVVERLLEEADSRELTGVYLLTTTADQWFPRFGFTRVDRADVPMAVAETWEFKTGCAQTAIAMRRLRPGT